MEGLIGKKVGMTQVYDENGRRTCVTVIEVGPCPVVQLRTAEKDGYTAVQLGFGEQKISRLTKAEAGHLKKTGGLEGGVRVLKEFAPEAGEEVKVGDVITVKNFDGVKYVDVTGKMPGHMGAVSRKTVNLEVVQVRPEDNALLVKGSVPGCRNGIVFVRKSLKNNVIAYKAGKGAK